MKFTDFEKLAFQYNLIPVYEVITADLLTPVLAYLKIRERDSHCFLLESVEGKEVLGRYSFIGKDPKKFFFNYGKCLTVSENGQETVLKENLFDYIRREINLRRSPVLDELPFFTGGLVGYIGYENISLIENVIAPGEYECENPDSILGFYETLVAFDHYKNQIILITNVSVDGNTNLESAYKQAKEKLSELRQELASTVNYRSDFSLTGKVESNIDADEFNELVLESKKRIAEGDIFQIVLSRRFSSGYEGDLLNVYRALRILNPSPYMYFLEFGDRLTVIGTSPENLVKVKNYVVETMPIAGTRKRGKTPEEDRELESELVNDPKERAEHVMLLDLGRNDLGRVCRYNSINAVQQMSVQRYSHVMHMVSRVEGRLDDGKDCVDALQACFPAGTVTGAPKIKAMQLIKGYEKQSRNVYAGAIGHIDFSGNLDMCIAIRTLFAGKNRIHWQAGAGIVADSIPELEEMEIRNKSEVLCSALQYAGGIDEDTCS
ncbi:MAG: anthranilate synthase component I [Ignavibacteria bacterium]|jgi:anthranilate synthase component 1|nr:anthranilate synthase component I [Ignavibacteria bacterium]MCU7505145.1 anthranilate synthase component I [Ignavibacteria bacterium]MCU7518002.1 anthranilate synthase component I [Ignavibacteria bacterium]